MARTRCVSWLDASRRPVGFAAGGKNCPISLAPMMQRPVPRVPIATAAVGGFVFAVMFTNDKSDDHGNSMRGLVRGNLWRNEGGMVLMSDFNKQ